MTLAAWTGMVETELFAQVAWVLNCQLHDLPVLVATHLHKPLGNPSPYNIKYFAASGLLQQISDRTWLARVTNALNPHWQRKNAVKKNGVARGLGNGPVSPMIGRA